MIWAGGSASAASWISETTFSGSTTGSRPAPYAASTAAEASAADSVKLPRWNTPSMISRGSSTNTTKNGADRARVTAIVRFCACSAAPGSPWARRRLISGSSTVPAAMPITPIGSW